jgi:hypothetical protein
MDWLRASGHVAKQEAGAGEGSDVGGNEKRQSVTVRDELPFERLC